MAIRDYFIKNTKEKGLWSVEIVTLIYILFTFILMCIYGSKMEHFSNMLITRAACIGTIILFYYVWKTYPCRFTRMVRVFTTQIYLVWWYQEVYYFASQLPYHDHWFASIDWHLFGCQPSLEFSALVPSTFWSEAFNCGYYSYYYLMMVVITFYAIRRYKDLDKASFIFLSSFFMFYIIYEFLPVAGPYYYFKAIGIDGAKSGIYPDLGHYFQTHHEMLHAEVKGIFSQLVHNTQEYGELPSAAFPSSHCGITIVLMILAWKARNPWLFWLMMPFAILLCMATVYIMAHYLIDTIAGVIFAFAFYFINAWIYTKIKG